MADTLVFKDISCKQIYDYDALKTTQEAIRYLRAVFKIKDDERGAIQTDLLFYAMSFAKSQDLSAEQISAFLSIVQRTHHHVASSPIVNLEKDYDYFKTLLLKHCVQRPPFSEKVFDQHTMKIIGEYMVHTYFRHYLMYKYAFTKKMRMQFSIENFMPTDVQQEEEVSLNESGDGYLDNNNLSTTEAHSRQSENLMNLNVAAEKVEIGTLESELKQSRDALAQVTDKVDSVVDTKISESSLLANHPGVNEIRALVMAIVGSKLDEIKSTLAQKVLSQEEVLNTKLKKFDISLDHQQEDKDKKKDVKPGKAKK